jgi:hypothetical protein
VKDRDENNKQAIRICPKRNRDRAGRRKTINDTLRKK